ncbi:sugar phosphate isomerase/epimerase family protein [Pleomorphovibrio marinus]|uniref:sugar phosphate isomerase/epimerase family protein n=1 Tax=Pleomorphovibrio marinus TaxID=2164132 RepID=UPI001300702C|nr:sugar phosphate isomerase/epimerase family protein [Pleomorphovibrio marinus]
MNTTRRKFLKTATISAVVPFASLTDSPWLSTYEVPSNNLKLSLNAYSFNGPLTKQEMSLAELFDFCAEQGFRGVDLTAYYLKGYPEVPSDSYLYEVKRQALARGLHISGTGVRNDFTYDDANKREKDKTLVKNWIVAAAKLGAPILRIFSGVQKIVEEQWEAVAAWMVEDIKECVEFGAEHGVLVAMQNHDDFITTAEQVNYLSQKVNSPWYGLVLDIGSYSVHDPYSEIEKNIHHAVSWQIKELVNHYGEPKPVNLGRLFRIIANSNYHGYLPIETLGPGDPKKKVSHFLTQVRLAMKESGLRAG